MSDTEPDEVVDHLQAAELLEVEPAQIEAMVEEGLLEPVEGTDQPRFRRREVLALRLQGG